MLTGLTRAVSPNLGVCELTYVGRQPIDLGKAVEQHRAYEACLASLGVRILHLPPLPDVPDAMFVEDPAVVFDEIAIIGRMGVESRLSEADSVTAALQPYRTIKRLRAPATLEGGDILIAGKTVYAGLSTRTNEAGIAQLAAELQPFGYHVEAVPVNGCLHLKTACSYLGDGAILANRDWFDATALAGLRVIDVIEPWAANVLRIGDTVLMPDGFTKTERKLRDADYCVETIDISELTKAEAGLTCMSILFYP